jgi:acetyl-CoA carboxylase biotin carboxyl carrier protein
MHDPREQKVTEPGTGSTESLGTTLATARDRARALLADLAVPPSALRVVAGPVRLEMTWAADPVEAGLPSPGCGERPRVDGDSPLSHVCSPSVGIVDLRAGPAGEPAVAAGQEVRAGDQVARIRLLDLEVPVRAAVGGTVVEVLRKDGDPVEHDEPLVVIAPA